jgi:signal transduction histidine kinase
MAMAADESKELERLRRILLTNSKRILLGSLVGNLIHDLNNPLTTLYGSVELLLISQAAQEPKIKKRLDSMHSSSKRMAEKLRCVQLLVKAGQPEERFNLNDLVHDIVAIADTLAKRIKITIASELPEEPLIATGNPNQLAHAVLAILDNAIDAVEHVQGPRVSIATSRSSPDRVSIVVRNNGPAIGEEIRERIFEPFFTTREDRAGAGLFIARQIVEENRGEINWSSSPEETEFTIILPTNEKAI